MNNETLVDELNKTIVEKDDLIQKLKKELEYKTHMLSVLGDLIKTTLEKP